MPPSIRYQGFGSGLYRLSHENSEDQGKHFIFCVPDNGLIKKKVFPGVASIIFRDVPLLTYVNVRHIPPNFPTRN